MKIIDVALHTDDALIEVPDGATHAMVYVKGGTSTDGNHGDFARDIISLEGVAELRVEVGAGGYVIVEWLGDA